MRIALPHKALIEVVVGKILFHKNREQPVEKLGSSWANESKLGLSGTMIKKYTKKITID